ncbi:hypothetical protein GCM10008995_06690 [Halobellus salinus]|uniref:AAA family ATPase n=1 Tax=Halobellus salinus TaxID=931585 RepID=A0A830EDF8_9EURY|nr:ATP-binding protein [Halobellus salinus]GGI99443.1 hypothetical protein GCM10008995_06690 [Halobellus salinus]SMP04670.1 hypothetical protein SAMN06265347_1027 [Halobellus salinus]
MVDPDSLNPAVHLSEPVGREALVEAFLNAVDPLFDRALPPNTYVWGPAGPGNSVIVTALLSALDSEMSDADRLYTATRGGSDRPEARFVYRISRQVPRD